MRTTHIRVVSLFLLCVMIVGCSFTRPTYSNVAQITTEVWQSGQSAVFEFMPLDTQSADSEISILLRTKAYLNHRMIRLAVKTTDPDRIYWVDTVAVPIADPGSMPLVQSEIVVRSAIRFPKNGVYRLSVSPVEDVKGVVSVGAFVVGAENIRENQTK